MLLPVIFYLFYLLADVITNICGRCYSHISITFGERFKEHQKAPSPTFDHFNTTGHNISVENFNIVEREDENLRRAIKEALYIRVNNPSLN